MAVDPLSSIDKYLKVLVTGATSDPSQICEAYVATVEAVLNAVEGLPVAIDRLVDAIQVLSKIFPVVCHMESSSEALKGMAEAASQLLSRPPSMQNLPPRKAAAWLDALPGIMDIALMAPWRQPPAGGGDPEFCYPLPPWWWPLAEWTQVNGGWWNEL